MYAAAAALTDDTITIAASHTAGRAVRRATRAPAADPIASPAMNAAAIVANAYVVGPMTSASSRVHATSYTSAAKPDSAAAAHARTGDGVRVSTFNRGERKDRGEPFFLAFEECDSAFSACSPVSVFVDSHSAPTAAMTFNVTPT